MHDPRVFINSRRSSIRVRVLLRLFCQEQFRRSSVCEIPTSEINHTSAIWLLSFLFLLVFFVAQVGINLLGEVNRIRVSVDNQRSCGAKIIGFGSFDLKPDQCVVLHQNDSYHHLMEDQDPRSHQVILELTYTIRFTSIP